MEDLVASSQRGISKRSVGMTLVSAAIQLGVLALLIVIPLLATDAMPTVPSVVMMTFAAPPPPPPPPPRPTAPRTTANKAVEAPRIPKPIAPNELVAPTVTPDAIVEDLSTAGSDFTMPGPDLGGVPGGSLDGVVGGLPGGPVVEPVRVGGEIEPPKKLKDVRPQYPSTARAARVEGMVVLEAVIDSRGVVTNVRVVKSIPLLDEAAVEAVKQWRYQATMLNGQAVPVVMTVTLNFGLEAA
jgi:protein TonB